MKLQEIVQDRKELEKFFKIGVTIIEEDNFCIETDNSIIKMYKKFLENVLGEEFVKKSGIGEDCLQDYNIPLMVELVYLKFKDNYLLDEYIYEEHDKLMELKEKYYMFKKRLGVVDDLIRKFQSKVEDAESERTELFNNFLK